MSIIFHLLALDFEIVSQLQNSSLTVSTFLYDQDGNERSLDIEKAWQSIHFVLTGKTGNEGEIGNTILEKVIMGGKEIGDDVGYGSANLLEILEVKEIAEELEKISKEKFIEIFNSRDFTNVEIYAFNVDDLELEVEYSSDYYNELREYYLEAASRQQSMLLYLN